MSDTTPSYPPLPSPCNGYPPALGEARLLSDAELAQSLASTIAHWDGTSDLWLFGYGSLIWNPGMPAVETARARVRGYHLGICFLSRVNPCTPEQQSLEVLDLPLQTRHAPV